MPCCTAILICATSLAEVLTITIATAAAMYRRTAATDFCQKQKSPRNRGLFSILRKLGFFDHPFAKELVLTIQTISQTA